MEFFNPGKKRAHQRYSNIFFPLRMYQFLWQIQIQTIEYGLNDAMQIKKKQVKLILYSFYTLRYEFQTILLSYDVVYFILVDKKIFVVQLSLLIPD